VTVRYSTMAGIGLFSLMLVNGGLAVHGRREVRQAKPLLARTGALVRDLRLTDLCLFTEASYTRHPGMADLQTPFQDSPLSMEHFPSGSLTGPPPHLSGGLHRRLTVYRHGR